MRTFITHEEVLRREMRDPRFAFWWYVYVVRQWLWERSKAITDWLWSGL